MIITNCKGGKMRISTWFLGAVVAVPSVLAAQGIQPSDQMKRAIMAQVGDKLKDGASARYRWLPEKKGGVSYCGFVNAKNSYGAYAGWAPFYILGAHSN